MRLARLLSLPVLATLLVLAPPAVAATTKVAVHDDYYGNDPNSFFVTVRINPGDTVEWDWKNTVDPHTVTSTPSITYRNCTAVRSASLGYNSEVRCCTAGRPAK